MQISVGERSVRREWGATAKPGDSAMSISDRGSMLGTGRECRVLEIQRHNARPAVLHGFEANVPPWILPPYGELVGQGEGESSQVDGSRELDMGMQVGGATELEDVSV